MFKNVFKMYAKTKIFKIENFFIKVFIDKLFTIYNNNKKCQVQKG